MNPSQIPIGYRLRRDIAWQPHNDGHSIHPQWIAEDSLTCRLFRCGEAEYQLLHWLDGEATFESIQRKFSEKFAPLTIDLHQVRDLVAKCNKSGMLHSTHSTRNANVNSFDIEFQARSELGCLSKSPLSTSGPAHSKEVNWFLILIRWLSLAIGKLTQTQIPLGSPDRWLLHVAPKLGWIYSGVAACFWLGLLSIAGVFIGARFDLFLSEMPDLQSLRSPGLLVGYGAIFIVTRFLHELGHAVVCKRAGASCKDAGLIVSFGMICPYVDITDAWRIGSRTIRMGIAMAGVYTECVLAFFAATVWLTTHPGWAHEVALQTLLVCTVSTLLFNANPLMKYDGYFVLCDWLGTQNLREKSFETFDAMLDGRARRESMGMSLFLLFYFFGSNLNRIILMAGLVAMVYFLASQWQLAGLGLGLIVLYGCCAAITTLAAFTITVDTKAGRRVISRRAAWLGWIAVSLLIAWTVNLPLPDRTYSIGTLQLGDRQPVYTSLPGQIDRTMDFSESKSIEPETTILTLCNSAVQKSVFDLEARLTRIDRQLETLDRLAFYDNRAIATKPMLVSQKGLVLRQLEQKRDEQTRLTITAPSAGMFEPAASTPAQAPENPSDIAFGFETSGFHSFSTCWISDTSIGRHVDRGTLIGWIVHDPRPRIECRLSEEQVNGIGTATEVRVCLAQDSTTVYVGRVVEVASMSKAVETRKKNSTQSQELSPMTYQVRIELTENRAWRLYSNGTAEVVFIKPSQSIFRMALDKWMRDSKMR